MLVALLSALDRVDLRAWIGGGLIDCMQQMVTDNVYRSNVISVHEATHRLTLLRRLCHSS